MRLLIPLLGRTREPYLDAGVRDYAGRLGRFAQVELPVLKERHSRREADEVVKGHDAALLLAQADHASLRVALDPAGRMASSEELADLFRALIRNRAAMVFAAVAAAVAICAWSSDDRIYAAMMSAAIFASMRELSRLPEIFRLQRQFRGAHPAA